MEEIILIAILSVLVGGSGFGAIVAFFFCWLFDRMDQPERVDPKIKPLTEEEIYRSWALGCVPTI